MLLWCRQVSSDFTHCSGDFEQVNAGWDCCRTLFNIKKYFSVGRQRIEIFK